ncbi:MAG: DnaJ domain-containing protein [Pseudomonadota bacterium]
MVRIVLIVFALIGLGLLVHWFLRTEPRQILKTLRWAGLALAIIIGVVLVATKQFQLIYALAIFLLPWLLRVRALRNRMKTARGPTPGQASEVRTRFVVMQLDHDTGHMDGIVQEGPFAGRTLSDMSLEDVVDLFRQAVAEDEASAQVLQAYLERMHGEDWRARSGAAGAGAGAAGSDGGGSSPGPIGVEEARAILGVGPNASDDEIKRAHRSLMKQFHPDHGGSDYLAARINEAKEVLLGDR